MLTVPSNVPIVDVPVTDNQLVEPGAVLVRLDDRDYRAQADQAAAQVDQAAANIANIDAQVAAQQANMRVEQLARMVDSLQQQLAARASAGKTPRN